MDKATTEILREARRKHENALVLALHATESNESYLHRRIYCYPRGIEENPMNFGIDLFAAYKPMRNVDVGIEKFLRKLHPNTQKWVKEQYTHRTIDVGETERQGVFSEKTAETIAKTIHEAMQRTLRGETKRR